MSGAKLPNDPPTQEQIDAAHAAYDRMTKTAGDAQTEITKLRRALEPLRHMRVRHDGNYAEADCEILNMVNGVQCVVGYARSGTEANEFDEIFEHVREALK